MYVIEYLNTYYLNLIYFSNFQYFTKTHYIKKSQINQIFIINKNSKSSYVEFQFLIYFIFIKTNETQIGSILVIYY